MMYCFQDFQILCNCNIWSKIISGTESAYNKVVTVIVVSPISPVTKQSNPIFHLDHAKLLSVCVKRISQNPAQSVDKITSFK